MIAVYIPCKDEDEASTIAKALVEENLAACAPIWPIRSFFMWEGKIEDASEVAILAKSTEELYAKLEARVKELHSYDIPAIISWEIKSNEEYEKWLKKELAR